MTDPTRSHVSFQIKPLRFFCSTGFIELPVPWIFKPKQRCDLAWYGSSCHQGNEKEKENWLWTNVQMTGSSWLRAETKLWHRRRSRASRAYSEDEVGGVTLISDGLQAGSGFFIAHHLIHCAWPVLLHPGRMRLIRHRHNTSKCGPDQVRWHV